MSTPVPARSVNTTPPVFRENRVQARLLMLETVSWTFLVVFVIPVVVWVITAELRHGGVL